MSQTRTCGGSVFKVLALTQNNSGMKEKAAAVSMFVLQPL